MPPAANQQPGLVPMWPSSQAPQAEAQAPAPVPAPAPWAALPPLMQRLFAAGDVESAWAMDDTADPRERQYHQYHQHQLQQPQPPPPLHVAAAGAAQQCHEAM